MTPKPKLPDRLRAPYLGALSLARDSGLPEERAEALALQFVEGIYLYSPSPNPTFNLITELELQKGKLWFHYLHPPTTTEVLTHLTQRASHLGLRGEWYIEKVYKKRRPGYTSYLCRHKPTVEKQKTLLKEGKLRQKEKEELYSQISSLPTLQQKRAARAFLRDLGIQP